MKDIKEIDTKELKHIAKELNSSGLLPKKIKIVGSSNEQLLKDFSEAVEKLPEDTEIPALIATFYNDIYADEMDDSEEIDPEDGDEIDDHEEEGDPEDEEVDPEDEEVDPEEEGDEPEEEVIIEKKAEKVVPVKEKKAEKVVPVKEKKPPVVRDKTEKQSSERRATINPKMSLADKVKNILDFAGQGYKQTTYFPLDCETVRILETNVGLYPTEIQSIMLEDKRTTKKDKVTVRIVDLFNEVIRVREINKIKSAYSYIVGAVSESKAESKFRHIMVSLVAGKQVPVEVAHPSTVKVARRALLAYMHCQGIDYATLTAARKGLTVAASKKEAPEAVAPKAKPEAVAPKAKPGPVVSKAKSDSTVAPKAKPGPKAKPSK